MKTYQCWAPFKKIGIERIEAESSFAARKAFAIKHGLDVFDVASRPLALGEVYPRF